MLSMLQKAEILLLCDCWECRKMHSCFSCSFCLCNLGLSDVMRKVGVELLTVLFLKSGKGELCFTLVSPHWPVWSLGEGQTPEDVDKLIDNPPLSTLLIEKPQSGTVPVGEWPNMAEELKRAGKGNAPLYKLYEYWRNKVKLKFQKSWDQM